MDQLYEAMPIPLSSDDEGDRLHPQQQSQQHRHSSRSAAGDARITLDVSAHGSLTRSSSFSSSFSSSSSSHVDDEYEVAAAEGSRAHHRAFSTTSSPDELLQFLSELLEVAEGLQARLDRLCSPSGGAASAWPSSHTHGPYTASAPGLHGQHRSDEAMHCGGGTSLEKKKDAEEKEALGVKGADHSGRGEGGGGSEMAACQGIAKLRVRLRKEAENLRRTVEGLWDVAAKDDAITNGTTSSSISNNQGGKTPLAGCSAADIPTPLFNAAVSLAQCNSIAHFSAVIVCLENESGVAGVYVPISGHVGPPQLPPSAAATLASQSAGAAAVLLSPPKAVFADSVRIEVDVVSCHGRRWIKVKTATPRTLALEAAALDLNGSTPFTDMLLALSERARRACLPHRQSAHVAVVFLHSPPTTLQQFLRTHAIPWACLPARLTTDSGASGTAVGRRATPSVPRWLPRVTHAPLVVCLDTTALVTLCSQSCFADSMPLETRLSRLAKYRVLHEQQRKEAVECAAVAAVVEPALRSYTTWRTAAELDEGMRLAMLREDAAAQPPNGTKESSSSGAVNSGAHCASRSGVAADREAWVPPTLLCRTDLSWLPPLLQAAKERPSDAPDSPTRDAPLQESALLVEASERFRADPTLRPNWCIADITYEEFRWILETIAGPNEVERASRLLELVTVVDTTFLRGRMACARGESSGSPAALDAAPHSPPTGAADGEASAAGAARAVSVPPLLTSVEYLRVSGKVSLRNKIVFGLADAVGGVIVTSNEQLCHAAREQGVVLEACPHPSRSLTEQKMYQLRRRHGPAKPPAVQ